MMKKYIKPNTEIEMMTLAVSILDPSLQVHNDYSDASALSNQSTFDDMDETYLPKGNGLWDDVN